MRTPRKQCESNVYHVVARGTARQLIFENDPDRTFFLRLLSEKAHETNCTIYAWCLMGNHVHVLVRAPMEDVSRFFKLVCGNYAQAFNVRNGRTGHLFQERFKSEPVSDDSYFQTVVRYIHMNPEKAGLASCAQYRWSSFSEYIASKRSLVLCDTDYVLDIFGGIEEFMRFHQVKDDNAVCLDADAAGKTRPMRDEEALALVQRILEEVDLADSRPADLKTVEKKRRDDAIRRMSKADLSIRQIERLTGIGRGAIQYVLR